MEGFGYWFGRHFVAPFSMFRDAGILGFILICIWLVYPVAVQTVIHPTDAVGFQAYIQGLPIAQEVTRQVMIYGELSALFMLAFLTLLQFLVLLFIYRRVQYTFSTWLVALILIGGIANGVWWLRTGYFDPWGAFAGLMPLIAMVGLQGVLERLGQDFVFGKGVRPHYADVY
jgi:hypothetical protein